MATEVTSKVTNFKPLQDRLLVQPQAREETSSAGIFLPDSSKEKPQQGKILAAGPGRRLDNGSYAKLEVNVGELVLYAKYGGTEIKIEGQEYILLKESDVLAVIE